MNSKYCNVFTENKRVVSIISTAEFGKVWQCIHLSFQILKYSLTTWKNWDIISYSSSMQFKLFLQLYCCFLHHILRTFFWSSSSYEHLSSLLMLFICFLWTRYYEVVNFELNVTNWVATKGNYWNPYLVTFFSQLYSSCAFPTFHVH